MMPPVRRLALLVALAAATAACSGSLARRGRDALDRGDLALASELLTRAAAQTPQDPDIWRDLARAHLRAGHPEVAAPVADEALSLSPTAELRLLRAQIHMALDERDAARRLVRQAVPDLRAASRLDEAAVLLLRLGEVDAALQAARQAVARSKGAADSYVNLAVLAQQAHRPQVARSAVAEGLARHPADPHLLATDAALLLRAGKLREARDVYLRLLPVHEQPGVVHQALALIEFELGDLAAAERHARAAVATIGRTHPYVRDTLATIRAARQAETGPTDAHTR